MGIGNWYGMKKDQLDPSLPLPILGGRGIEIEGKERRVGQHWHVV